MKYHICLFDSLHRLNLIFFYSVFFMLFSLVACPKAPDYEAEQIIGITGTVTDENSGFPIMGASVQIYNRYSGGDGVLKSTETDQEGRYYMEYQGQRGYLNPSGYSQPNQLRAMAEGYYTQYKQIGSTESLQTINFQLSPVN
jgi:5-hydroxyisourate hydrolase-like protein (transthyretin family)